MKTQILILLVIIIFISCNRMKPLIIVNNSEDTLSVSYNHELIKPFPGYFFILPYDITKKNYDYIITDKYVLNTYKWNFYRPYETYKNCIIDTLYHKTYIYLLPNDSVEIDAQFSTNSEVNLITSKMNIKYNNDIIEGIELFKYLRFNDMYNIIQFDSLLSQNDSFKIYNTKYTLESSLDSMPNFKKYKTLNIYYKKHILREYNTFDSTLTFINYKKNILNDKEYFISNGLIDSIYVYSKFNGKFKWKFVNNISE